MRKRKQKKEVLLTGAEKALIKLELVAKSGSEYAGKARSLILYYMRNQKFSVDQWHLIRSITKVKL